MDIRERAKFLTGFEVAGLHPDSGPLLEGRDYYVEDGRWVFTAEYLKRRGHCCGSGCRHCPYRTEEVDLGLPSSATQRLKEET